MADRVKSGFWTSANELIKKMPHIDTVADLYVCGLNQQNTDEVQQYLLRFYSAETTVLVFANMDGSAQADSVRLADLNPQDLTACDIKIEGCSGFDKSVYCFGDLMRIMRRLTAADGCPWDIAQTHQSIKSNMLEEAGEAVAAIDSGDTENLIEELGDVMLQSVFHADIASRGGGFCISDVISVLCKKLYTRHTHVFGDKKASDAGEALQSWKTAKAAEKQRKKETK